MGSVLGKRTVEEPVHEMLFKAGEEMPTRFEIREYPERWAACTEYDSGAFMRLAGYIGVGSKPKNAGAVPIAMTAPVVTGGDASHKGTTIAMTAPVVNTGTDMAFILPSRFGTSDVPPAPLDERVRVELLPAEYLAVTTFNGSLQRDAESDPKVLSKRDAIVADAKALGLMDTSVDASTQTFRVFRYNPPWTLPYFRTNEVAIPLSADQVKTFLASTKDDT